MSTLGFLDKFAGKVIEEAAKKVGEEIKKKQTEQKPRPATVTARAVSLSDVKLQQAGEQPQEHEKLKCVGEQGVTGKLKDIMPR